MVCVTRIVTGSAPQLNLIVPPFATSVLKAPSVQLLGVPLPTRATTIDVSMRPIGDGQIAPVGVTAGRTVIVTPRVTDPLAFVAVNT